MLENYANLALEITINSSLESKIEKTIHSNAFLPQYTPFKVAL